jgi:Leucine-rich repeat (LRR) protein
MKVFNAHVCAARLVSISKLLRVGLTVILASISMQAFSAPLPNFSDPNMQACFDDQAAANNWLQAEDVDKLLCPKRNIVFPGGMEQLTSLIELDLSHNPIDYLPPLFAQAQTLKQLNLSGTTLYDLVPLFDLRQLTHLILNDVSLMMTPANPSQVQQQLTDVVRDNPGIKHLGLNGFALTDPYALFNELSTDVVSLELSNTRLSSLPVPLDQFTQLESLDLSHNPIDYLPPLFAQAQTLKQLNLSGTRLYDFVPLLDLRQLTHLFLNDVTLMTTPAGPNQIQQQLTDVVRDNPGIRHLGLNGVVLTDPYALFNELSTDVVSLELSNTSLSSLPVPLDQFTQLEVLDLSHNPIENLPPLFAQAQTLKQLNLSGTTLYDLMPLLDLRQLTHLILNDVTLTMTPSNPSQIQQQLTDLLRDNLGIRHLGLNGFALTDPYALFNELSTDVVSLELSNASLSSLPVTLDQFTQLEVLDLSHNPIENLPPLIAQAQTLKQLNLSGTTLYDLVPLLDLRQLTHLLLNDVTLTMTPADPIQIQQQLTDLLRDNPGIRHLGLNGFELTDPYALFNELSTDVVSLELSNTSLSSLPVTLDQFTQLEVLDLSDNSIDFLGPLMSLEFSLKQLNLSNTNLPNLNELLSLKSLTHLFLNKSLAVSYSTQNLNQILLNNESLTHVGLTGIQLQTDLNLILNTVAGSLVVWLEIANVGAVDLALPALLIERLEYLDVSGNNLAELFDIGLTQRLESLIFEDNGVTSIDWLLVNLPALKFVNLSRNDSIACDDLDTLSNHFGDTVELTKPANCVTAQLQYCSAGGQNTNYEWIASVSVNGQQNATSSDGGYGDHSSVEFSAAAGQNVAIELEPGFAGSSYQENWSVWVDYNGDGVFENSEQVVASSSNSVATANFVVPTQALNGQVRMRVAMQWGGAPGACGSFTYGEVEDYTLLINN